MRPQFEWQVGNDGQQWETIAKEQEDILLLLQEEANRLFAADPLASKLTIRSVRVVN